MTKLWVDDEREAPLDWMWAKTNAGAIDLLRRMPIVHLSLDFSLVGETTDEIMHWLHDHPAHWPTGSITCHSSSRDAVRLIERLVADFAPGPS